MNKGKEQNMGSEVRGLKNFDKAAANPPRSDFGQITPEILAALRDGDYRAFDRIYFLCFGPIEIFARMLLRNDSEAEEVCQELFAKLWEKRENIDPQRNFKSYMYTLVKSAVLNRLEHKNVVNKYVNFRLKSEPDMEYSPDESLMSNEVSLMVQIAIDRMPEQRQRVFRMSRMEELSNEQIAKRLNITTATVRAHLHHATKELRELMALFILLFMA